MEQLSAEDLKELQGRLRDRAKKLSTMLDNHAVSASSMLIQNQVVLIFWTAQCIYGETQCQDALALIHSLYKNSSEELRKWAEEFGDTQ